jgi:outer membrane receptor protein involved in Fe transport
MMMTIKILKILRGGYRPIFLKVANFCKVLPLLLCLTYQSHAQNEKLVVLDSIEVVGIMALHGIDVPRNKVASKIQQANYHDFARLQSTDYTDFLNQRFSAVHLNDPNGNMLYPDFQYRGFVASPLLGMSQGIAVYQDGVRMNELFGDIVNWELIPRGGVANVELSSGSNPLYGLNALGGALSFQTKSGFSHQGQSFTLNGGSFGRISADYSGGWKMVHPEAIGKGKSAFFINANHFREQGWRKYSPSVSSQIFGKYSLLKNKSAWHIAMNLSKSNMRGNGPLPVELLATERNGVFTYPDNIENTLGSITVHHLKELSHHSKLNTNFYFKHKKNHTFNGDVGPYDDFNGFLVEDVLDSTQVEYLIDQNGSRIKATKSVKSAINNRTKTVQNSVGGNIQLAFTKPIWGKENQLVVGVNMEGGQANFTSSTELALLTEERGTIGSGLYDSEAEVFVKTKVLNSSLYVTNTLSVSDKMTVNLSLTIGHSFIQLEDQIGNELNGTHNFLRINPSAGFVYELPKSVHLYANFSQSMRNPTPVELSCADKDAPCRLPNAFLSDPPLKQTQARTAEIGFWTGKKIRFEASIFRTAVKDDIYFISSGPSRNTGFFTNIGNTQRAGIELSLSKGKGNWRWQTSYTFTNATFKTAFVVNSPNHPDAHNNEIAIEKGNRLPLIPQHIAKAGMDYAVKKWLVGIDAIFNSSQYLRGDEANLLAPLTSFTLVNCRAEYKLNNNWTFFGRIQNLLNSRYETFGLLGNPAEAEDLNHLTQPQFLTPNTPFMFNVGIKWKSQSTN